MQEELIKQFQAGNRQAGEDFYKANKGLVCYAIKQCFSKVLENEEVVALVNQAFVHSMKNFKVDNEKNASFPTYFTVSAKGAVRNHLRDRAFTLRPSRQDFREGKITPCSSLEQIIFESDGEDIKLIDVQSTNDDYTQIIVDEMLNKINKTDREAFILNYRYELSQVQIAEILGTSQVSVSRRIARAKSRLKEILSVAC